MYSVAFIFEPGDYDDEFFMLDSMIQQAAESMQGYLGKENWQSANGNRKNSIYYWRDLEALKDFTSHPQHLEAKRQYAKWYKGYQVVVARIERAYGDGKIGHITEKLSI